MADDTSKLPLSGKRLIVGVCGGIAAYKACEVVSQLAQRGAQVHVVMTDAATKFVTPLTFESLSANKVATSSWTLSDSADPQHIKLTEKGERIAKEIPVEPMEIFRAALSSLTREETRELLKISTKLAKRVQEMVGPKAGEE